MDKENLSKINLSKEWKHRVLSTVILNLRQNISKSNRQELYKKIVWSAELKKRVIQNMLDNIDSKKKCLCEEAKKKLNELKNNN